MIGFFGRLAAGAAAALLLAVPASAQQEQYHLGLLGITSGTTAPGGLGFASLSLTNKRAAGRSDGDGSAVLGFGFGDAATGIGGQVALHMTSLSDDFGDSGYLSLKFSRQFSAGPNPVYGSLQFGQLANWGDADGRDVTTSVAITRFGQIERGAGRQPLPVMMTLGAGTHVRNAETDAGVFGGVGVGVSPTTALSIAWTGDDLTLGSSFKFRGADNLVVGVGIDDATNRNDNRRLIVSFGYSFNLFGG